MLDIGWDPGGRENKPLKWILIDSLIIAGIAFVASLPANRLPSLLEFYVALRAFVYAFLVQLAVERGLKPAIKKRG